MTMYLVELFLPLYDNDGHKQPGGLFRDVRAELLGQFGGVTLHSRAPVHGLWEEPASPGTVHDDLVIYEVMAERLDRKWWRDYRAGLEARFRQQEILVRAHRVRRL